MRSAARKINDRIFRTSYFDGSMFPSAVIKVVIICNLPLCVLVGTGVAIEPLIAGAIIISNKPDLI